MKANTTPLAPHNATFGKKNQFTSPVTSAVIPMTSNIFEGPYFSSSQRRTQKKDIRHVPYEMRPAAMTDYMSEKAHVSHDIFQ